MTTPSPHPESLQIPVPRDYLLHRDACSYGYFLLAPNHWNPHTLTFHRTFTLENQPVKGLIWQGDRPAFSAVPIRSIPRGSSLTVALESTLSDAQRRELSAQVHRMLNLHENHTVVRSFHRADPRFKASGRARLFRSPTLFEDVIKTVTSCNVAWPSTIIMNKRLCEVVGEAGAFPTPAQLARTRVATLRARCSVGYRDQRLIDLAKLFHTNQIDEAHLTNPATSDEEVLDFLLELPGIGPYAAANILQLLGRYAHLPLDTESVRHGRTILGFKGSSAQIMKKVKAHFAPMRQHTFRSYWFEMWEFYEAKRGKSWTWDRETTGKTFTASALKDEGLGPKKSAAQKKKNRRPRAK